MSLSSPIFALKREARQLGRRQNLPLHAALNAVARREGFRSWSHLSSANAVPDPLRVLSRVVKDGGLFLLAGRPGQGKTLLALRLLDQVARSSVPATLFSLDYSAAQVNDHLTHLDLSTPRFEIDISDEITAQYVAEHMAAPNGPRLAVIDFLQVMDQRRTTPALADQVARLSSHAAQNGGTIIVLSQVDRRFDLSSATMPTPQDIRQPNPFALSAFDAIVTLHGGQCAVYRRD